MLQLESKRSDGLAGPDSSQIAWEVLVEQGGDTRNNMCGEGEQEPPLDGLGQDQGVFCPPGNRDVLQGLSGLTCIC